MWEIANGTSYAAESSWARDKNGLHLWLVAVKASFDIADNGKLSLADEQPPPLLAPEYWGEPGLSSLRFDVDVVPPKAATDVLVMGSAHAPAGRPATKVIAGLRIAEIDKRVIVHGPRTYFVSAVGTLEVGPPRTFVSCPIRYEDAFGGADVTPQDPRKHRYDARNPVGKGVTIEPLRLHHQAAHRIEYPGGTWGQGPAGFGPIDAAWSPRREHMGTYDDAWERKKKPLLPDDYSDLSLLSTPVDQRPRQTLRGDEPVLLTQFTPAGVLSFQLPKIFLAFTTYFGERCEEHRAQLGTVIIDADQKKLMLVWQTSLPVKNGDVDYLDETVVVEKAYL